MEAMTEPMAVAEDAHLEALSDLAQAMAEDVRQSLEALILHQ